MFDNSIPLFMITSIYIFVFLDQRAIYKDLVLLLQKNDYISDRQLRTKVGYNLHVLRSNRYLRYILPLVRDITLIWIYDLF